jgi:hypothetical protein
MRGDHLAELPQKAKTSSKVTVVPNLAFLGYDTSSSRFFFCRRGLP